MRRLKHPIALFVVAVLAVIGIGAGVVGGLPTPRTYAIGRATYSLGGVQFAIDFPGVLGPLSTVSKGVKTCGYIDDAVSSQGNLAVAVVVTEPEGCGGVAVSFNSSPGISESSVNTPAARSFDLSVPVACRSNPSELSWSRENTFHNQRLQRRGYEVGVIVESCKGTAGIQGILNSFEILKTG